MAISLSPGDQPGPYSLDHEADVVQFCDWYAETLTRDPADHRLVAAE